MSQAAQIYVRYNGLKGKGLIANYYGWVFGERLISRARYGLECILEHLEYAHQYYDKSRVIRLSRILDTNFDMKDVALSQDIIKERLDWYPEDPFKEAVFLNQQNDDGKLFIDICEDCVKYAFTDGDANLDHIMDAESYMVWDYNLEWRKHPRIKKDVIKACEDNIDFISKYAKLMTAEELQDFMDTEYVDFITEPRMAELSKEVKHFLTSAPSEDECSEQENNIYAELANLKQTLEDAGY